MKRWTLGLVGALWVTAGACSNSDSNGRQPMGTSSTGGVVVTTIGEEGGEASINGASLVVPAGALTEDTEIGVQRLTASNAEEFLDLLGAGRSAASAVYVFTPHGSQFDVPVTITLDYTSASSALTVLRLDDEDDRSWEAVAGTQFAQGEASFETTQFSLLVVTEPSDAQGGGDGGTLLADAGDNQMDATTTGGQPNITEDASSSESDSGNGAVTGDFEIELRTELVSVEQGGQGYFDVVATRADGFDGPIEVAIEGLPAGVTLNEGPTTIIGQDLGTVLYVTASAEAEIGETLVTLIASGGNTTRMVEGTLTVSAPAGTFEFGVLPYLLTIARGSSTETTLTLTPQNGFEGVVNLSLEFEPEGVTVSPLTVEMSGSEPTVQTLTFSAAEGTATGMTNVNLNFNSEQTPSSGTIGIGITIE